MRGFKIFFIGILFFLGVNCLFKYDIAHGEIFYNTTPMMNEHDKLIKLFLPDDYKNDFTILGKKLFIASDNNSEVYSPYSTNVGSDQGNVKSEIKLFIENLKMLKNETKRAMDNVKKSSDNKHGEN